MFRKMILSASAVLLAFSLSAASAQDEKRVVLVKEKILSKNTYLIVARGYAMEGSNRPADSAKEAALLNAQILAKERFNGAFDVIKNGMAEKYIVRADSADVHYVLTWPNIKRYLVRK